MFEDMARPGSSAEFQSLSSGMFSGHYSMPDGSLPGTPGDALGLTSFLVTANTPPGNGVFDFLSGRDFGAIFFDFFGPGTGDSFLFVRPDGVRFQINLISGFTGRSVIDSDSLFSLGTAYTGGIDVLSGMAYVPVPATIWLLFSAIGALALGRRLTDALSD
jgi:hypothetical protein